MVSHELLGWYESGLPLRERKKRGHFSTPPLLVEQILDACGYRPNEDLTHLRVMDPACGSGNFLMEAARRLITSGYRAGLSKRAIARAIQQQLWGFDPDPISCLLSEMQLRSVLTTVDPQSHMGGALHIHQADGLAFPWDESQNVDLFLANPPYLAAKNNDLSAYRSTEQRGQGDSYLLFLELALRVVRPGGWIGLVLPDPVLARANAAQERRRLLHETTLHQLWHLSGVFTAYVGAVVIVAQKLPPSPLHQVSWSRGRWQHDGIVSADNETPLDGSTKDYTVAQSFLASQPAAELRYLLSGIGNTLIERLHAYLCSTTIEHWRTFIPLSDLVVIRRGEELSKDSALLSKHNPANTHECYPVLRGGVDVRPYEKPVGRYQIERAQVNKPLERYLAPKLLVVKSTARLQATLDLHGHVVLQTLYMLNTREDGPQDARRTDQHIFSQEDELHFLLALLNSELLRVYVYVLYTAYKWVQPQMEQHVLARLPIPHITYAEKANIIRRAKLLMRACDEFPLVVELKQPGSATKQSGPQILEANLEMQQRDWLDEQERAICSLYEAALAAAATPKSTEIIG
jgi:hypothetical protein